jgi:hypothetical protein
MQQQAQQQAQQQQQTPGSASSSLHQPSPLQVLNLEEFYEHCTGGLLPEGKHSDEHYWKAIRAGLSPEQALQVRACCALAVCLLHACCAPAVCLLHA